MDYFPISIDENNHKVVGKVHGYIEPNLNEDDELKKTELDLKSNIFKCFNYII